MPAKGESKVNAVESFSDKEIVVELLRRLGVNGEQKYYGDDYYKHWGITGCSLFVNKGNNIINFDDYYETEICFNFQGESLSKVIIVSRP